MYKANKAVLLKSISTYQMKTGTLSNQYNSLAYKKKEFYKKAEKSFRVCLI